MSKARLRLIHCSDNIEPGARRQRHDRSFRPSVVDGGWRAISVPAENAWEAAFELVNLGLLVSQANYLAFLEASLAALEAHGWADAKPTS
jgi:hypothetical protein